MCDLLCSLMAKKTHSVIFTRRVSPRFKLRVGRRRGRVLVGFWRATVPFSTGRQKLHCLARGSLAATWKFLAVCVLLLFLFRRWSPDGIFSEAAAKERRIIVSSSPVWYILGILLSNLTLLPRKCAVIGKGTWCILKRYHLVLCG